MRAGLVLAVAAASTAITLVAAARAADPVPTCSGAAPAKKNGVLIVTKSRAGGTAGVRLYTVRPDGTHLRVLTRPKREDADVLVAPAPDGKRALLERMEFGAVIGTAKFVINLRTGHLRRLRPPTRAYLLSGIGAWSPVSKARLAMTRLKPTSRIELLSPVDGSTTELPAPAPAPDQLSWSANGRCLVGDNRKQITILPATGGSGFAFHPPGLGFIWQPLITPDGRHVVFMGARTPANNGDIYESRIDGTGLRKLAQGSRQIYWGNHVILSPDGGWLVYTDRKGTVARSITGGKQHRVLRGLYAVAWAPRPR